MPPVFFFPERLLAKPELLFQGTKPRTGKEVLTEMGVSKLLFRSEKRAETDAKESWAEYQRSECHLGGRIGK